MYIFHSSLNWYMITETLHEAQLKCLSHLSLPSIQRQHRIAHGNLILCIPSILNMFRYNQYNHYENCLCLYVGNRLLDQRTVVWFTTGIRYFSSLHSIWTCFVWPLYCLLFSGSYGHFLLRAKAARTWNWSNIHLVTRLRMSWHSCLPHYDLRVCRGETVLTQCNTGVQVY